MTTEIKEHVLVYHHHYTGKPIVKDGLEVITHSKLFDLLSTHTNLKLTRKAIPKNARYVDIHGSDLWTDSEKETNKNLPNADANLSSVKLSFRVLLERAIFKEYQELIILSDRPQHD